jgi:Rho GTPase-activating protein RGD1
MQSSHSQPPTQDQAPPRAAAAASHASAKPVFGISLEKLYDRDQLAVPMVVYQCIQAVDMYGLGVEGIYRLSGSVPHVNSLKSMFETGKLHLSRQLRNARMAG